MHQDYIFNHTSILKIFLKDILKNELHLNFILKE